MEKRFIETTSSRQWELSRAGLAWVLVLILGAASTHPAAAQYAIAFGGTGNERANGVTVDQNGNAYATGYFEGQVDFNPDGGATQALASAGGSDIFVASYDANGAYRWSFALGDAENDHGFGITSWGGNVYVTGSFRGSVDFDPDPAATALRVSDGAGDFFIASYDADGNYRWAFSLGSTGEEYSYGIAVDDAGNLYVSGGFSDTVDFDPDPSTTEARTSNGPWDVFLASYTDSGALRWVNTFGATGDDEAYSVALDGSNNVYLAGFFQGTVDFDPDPSATAFHTSAGAYDVFLASYDAGGAYRWSIPLGGAGNDFSIGVAVDGDANVYTTGFFHGTVDFDPSPTATASQTSAGATDVFVASYDDAGAFRWANVIGAAGTDEGHGIAVGGANQVFVTGAFEGSVDFDPDPAIAESHTSAGATDVFLVSFDAAGNFNWVTTAGSADEDTGIGVATDASGKPYVAGYFRSTIDFDPDPAAMIAHTSAGGTDAFLASYSETGFILPVELTYFNALRDGDAVLLQWETASETNNAGFEVQHRLDAEPDFRTIGFVEGHGTTVDAQRYRFRPEAMAPGRHVFRLKQVDYDGAFAYSSPLEVTVELAERFVLESAYPNPFNPRTTLRFTVRDAAPVRVMLYNTLGQPVRVLFEGVPEAGRVQELSIDGSDLPSGSYFVRLAGDGFAGTQRIILLK